MELLSLPAIEGGGSMDIVDTVLPAIKILTPTKLADDRGCFCETYSRRSLAKAGISVEFVQDNHAFSRRAATIRGWHFQIPPFAQDKLLRVVRGAVLDIIVDLRQGSPTFGRHLGLALSAPGWRQVFIPAGFAHGMCIFEPETDVIDKATNFNSPAHDKGVRWNDSASMSTGRSRRPRQQSRRRITLCRWSPTCRGTSPKPSPGRATLCPA
jgi:dTDP-4-dehydrorhamnose 3,5-epimerase